MKYKLSTFKVRKRKEPYKSPKNPLVDKNKNTFPKKSRVVSNLVSEKNNESSEEKSKTTVTKVKCSSCNKNYTQEEWEDFCHIESEKCELCDMFYCEDCFNDAEIFGINKLVCNKCYNYYEKHKKSGKYKCKICKSIKKWFNLNVCNKCKEFSCHRCHDRCQEEECFTDYDSDYDSDYNDYNNRTIVCNKCSLKCKKCEEIFCENCIGEKSLLCRKCENEKK